MSRLKIVAVAFFACGAMVTFLAVIEYQWYLSAVFPISSRFPCLTCIAEHSKTSAYEFVAASTLVFGILTLKIHNKRGPNVIAA